ncbi:hypothetical protein Tco_1434466 [Tanacetum coccineum]
MFEEREPLLDVELFAPVFEWVIPELLSVVGYDFSWQPESTHDVVPYEFLNLVSRYHCNWFYLDPLCKVIDSYDQEPYLSLCFWEWA